MEEKLITQRPTPFCEIIQNLQYLNLTGRFNRESALDMDIVEVDPRNPIPQVTDFDTYIKLKDGTTLIQEIVRIKNSAFQTLFDDALGSWTNGDKYFSGLKIWFGLNGRNVVPIFQPIYAKSDGSTHYDITNHENLYTYDSRTGHESFNLISINACLGLMQNYRTNIRIKHLTKQVFEPFVGGEDSEAVIYPLQTIFTLISDNKRYGTNYVMLVNSIATDKGTGTLLQRHGVLLIGEVSKDKKSELVTLENKYANRSHLCPPGCGKLEKTEIVVLTETGTTCP